MKKIVLILLSSIILIFSFWISVDAFSIFWGQKSEIPYCQWNDCWLEQGIDLIKNSWIDWLYTEWTASEWIQRILIYILSFLRLIMILVIIYAWFNMLTAWWDEDKFNKSKTILQYSIIWLVIVFLAWPITNFIINMLTQSVN